MDIINTSISFAKDKLAAFDGGHDWSHTERVLNNARTIHTREARGDLQVIELSAILHDIADTKFYKGAENDGGDISFDFLVKEGLDEEKAEHIRRIINNMSFKKHLEKEDINSIEFQIVQDADRLDAIGAIGIARAFNYGGYKNNAIYDPEQKPRVYKNSEEYKKSDSSTLNHFYEKLFLLKGMMNTPSGLQMAEERHQYMEEFVDRFMQEWKGKL